jgi:hypothetical protein
MSHGGPEAYAHLRYTSLAFIVEVTHIILTVMPHFTVTGLISGFLLILFNISPVLTRSLRLRDDIRVDSKPVSLCETTPGVESHSGYIRLQSGVLKEYGIDSNQDYPVNIFFWYFQNRKKRIDAPLTVYCKCRNEDERIQGLPSAVMGGPGASSCKTCDMFVT